MRKFVLDTNCFIAASRNDQDAADFEAFVQMAAPGLYLDILLAYSCRESGAVLISGNEQDLNRIRRVFSFQSAAPYPETI